VQESESLPRGLILDDRFRLGALRARGGMASIYEGTEIATDRHVAIKFLRQELTKVPEMVALFRAEAEMLEKLDHPNIIRGLGSGRFGDGYYLVMDFVTGPTLRERLRWGRPDRDEVMSILRQAAAGLDHAHERGIIHRDIKPDNFILEKNVVRIADFGIAHQQRTPSAPGPNEGESRGGTVIYSAPEQFAGGAVDRRTDVYSLGVVAYEMLTGRVPFAGYTPASTGNHQVPRAADAVLERAFNENPEVRFSTAGGFVQALEATFRAFAPDSTPAPRLEMLTPPKPMQAADPDARPPAAGAQAAEQGGGSGWKWLVLGAALVLGVAGILAWAFGLGPFGRKATSRVPERLRDVADRVDSPSRTRL